MIYCLSTAAFKLNVRRYTKKAVVSNATIWVKAVKVDPVKPKLKAPGTKRLKLKYDQLLSSVAFSFNLCRYIWDTVPMLPDRDGLTVGWCVLTLSNSS